MYNYNILCIIKGRRLRHVNDEILLNKWKQARENNQEFDAEEETASGSNCLIVLSIIVYICKYYIFIYML